MHDLLQLRNSDRIFQLEVFSTRASNYFLSCLGVHLELCGVVQAVQSTNEVDHTHFLKLVVQGVGAVQVYFSFDSSDSEWLLLVEN